MKKLEEAAKEYMNIPPVKAAIKCGDVEDLVSHIKVAYRNGFQDGQANQWISVEDEMPSFEDEVLCVMESNEAVVSGFIFKDGDKAKVAT